MKTKLDRRPRATDIRLDALSATEWRVCDKRAKASDHLSVLGFIEMRNEHFEVTRMSSPSDLVIFDSLDEARRIFTLYDAGRVHTGKFVV
ncbi:hypothetical protein ABIE21_001373 [Conyzicola nivalis]|jgi:hypothetical protein|uniref:Uncharacterized protein n=1 Tax=Conyzicola nivalis TaxID=1477021 RepID=A0ABV2QLY5_9MICO